MGKDASEIKKVLERFKKKTVKKDINKFKGKLAQVELMSEIRKTEK